MHPVIEKYTAGTDHIFDVELLPFDIVASKAHAKGLEKVGILGAAELEAIETALDALLQEYEAGSVTILKNGIEFAATYFVMLLVLLFTGAGRIVSVDYWVARRFGRG